MFRSRKLSIILSILGLVAGGICLCVVVPLEAISTTQADIEQAADPDANNSFNAALAADPPVCPEWAVNELGERCFSEAYSVTETTSLTIETWQVGRIQLHNATVSVTGLYFADLEGNEVDPANLQEGTFYTFRKVDDNAVITINVKPDPFGFSPATHIVIAK